VVPGGVLELDVACQQLAAECFGERDVGGVVGADVVPSVISFPAASPRTVDAISTSRWCGLAITG
jgi:hypothetical protein